MRRWGVCVDGRSLWWPSIARNKRSVAIDLRDERGRVVVAQLAQHCDIVLENFRPGLLAEWGLGYAAARRREPGGRAGARVGVRADRAARARARLRLDRRGDGRHPSHDRRSRPSSRARRCQPRRRARRAVRGDRHARRDHRTTGSGRGQEVDVAIYESVLALMESTVADWELAGVVRGRSGGVLPGVAPANAYPTADGHDVVIAANADAVFARLAVAVGRPEWATDPRYAKHAERGVNQVELDAELARWTSRHSADDVIARLREHAVPVGLINTAPDLAVDDHIAARDDRAPRRRLRTRGADGRRRAAARALRERSAPPVPSSASTPTRCCASSPASATPRSPRCAPPASSRNHYCFAAAYSAARKNFASGGVSSGGSVALSIANASARSCSVKVLVVVQNSTAIPLGSLV